MKRSVLYLVQAASIAACYIVLTLPLAQFAYGVVQLRLAEALSVLAALTPAAMPGLFLGCLIANLLNPVNLGPLDIIGGSLASLLAAYLSWYLSRRLKKMTPAGRLLVVSPAVLLNALTVGVYLPFLIPGLQASLKLVALSVFSVLVSQALVVYLIGLPLLVALGRTRLFGQR